MLARDRIDARLLFLSANVDQNSPLAVDREYNRVKSALESIGQWQRWRAGTEHLPAAEWDQLPGQLLAYAPTVVHFAGHGHSDGSVELSTHAGDRQRIQAAGLRSLFESYRGQIRVVVLNACYSDALASELVDHIDVVIGMTHAVSDDAAVRFAPAFYQQLAGGQSLETAFAVGRAVVLGADPSSPRRDLAAPPGVDLDAVPHMRVRAGVDPSRLFVAPRRTAMRTFALRVGGAAVAGAVGIGAWQLWPSADRDHRAVLDASAGGAAPAPLDLRHIAGGSGVAPFLVAATELTQEGWIAATGKNPSDPRFGIGPRYPVNNITWDEAIEVANLLSRRERQAPCYERAGGRWRAASPPCRGYRLLTDAEWKLLAQAPRREPPCATANLGDRTLMTTAPEIVEKLHKKVSDPRAFSCRDGHALLAPVGALEPDGNGLSDLDGNVSEWIWNGSPAARGRSFVSLPDRDPGAVDGLAGDVRSPLIGVRYARDEAR